MSIDTIFLILLTALCAWLDGTLIISLVRARKIGIVRVIFPANLTGLVLMVCLMAGLVFLSAESAASSRKYSDYVADMGTRGIEAVAEYENRTVDSYFEAIVTEKEEDYAAHIVSIEKARYEKQANLTRRQSRYYALSAVQLVLYLPGFIVIVTKDGLMYAGSVKPHKFSVLAREKRLCVYTDNSGYSEKPFIKLRGSEKNKELFSEYMATPESAEEKESV